MPEEFRPEGTLLEIGANKPFLPIEEENVWLIQSGKVDLFASQPQNGEGNKHVLRVDEGQALFGVNLNDLAAQITLIAVGGTQTKILEIQLLQMKQAPANAAAEVISLVETWITGLSSSISRPNPPRKVTKLSASDEVTTFQGQPLACKGGILWVRPVTGTIQWSGRTDVPLLEEGRYYPLADRMWISAPESSTVAVADTQTMLAKGLLWPSLSNYHAFILACLVADAEQASRINADSFKQRKISDQKLMANAVSELASVLDKDTAEPLAGEVGDDPLLSACRMVATDAGIAMASNEAIVRASSKIVEPLNSIAKASRFRTRKLILKGNWWKEDVGSLLAYLQQDNAPVALIRDAPGRYRLFNPANGSFTAVNNQIASTLTGIAYLFYRPFPDRKLGAADLLRFGLYGTRKDVAVIVALGIAAGLLGLLVPIVTGVVYGSIIPSADRTQLWELTLGLVVAAMATAIFQVAQSIALLRVEGKVDFSLQSALWDRLLSLPVPFFRNYTAGDLATRADGIDMIRQILSTNTITSVLASIFSLFNFVLLYYYDWQLALVGSALILIAMIITSVTGYLQLKHQRPVFLIQAGIAGMVYQFFNGIAKLRVAAAEPRAYATWAKRFADQKQHSMDAKTVANRQSVFDALFPVVSSMCIFGWMAFQSKAILPTGIYLSFNAAFSGFVAGMLQINRSVVSCLNIIPIFDLTRSILEELPEVDVSKNDPGELAGEIEVSHISFRYSPDTPVILKDVSIKASPGEFIAICGASGSGKSTLLRLLLGFEQPESGSLYYDGLDFNGLDPRAVRRQMGVVLQSSQLLSGDIFTNIVGSSLLTQEDAWEAAVMAGFDEDIKQMPMGMFTVISEGGGNISGGQRQRLMIARAIVNKPRILFFDEATSALDNRSQSIVSRALEKLQATRVVIAHRLSTIRNAHRIYVMDAGKVVQSGSYEQLIKEEGVFLDLARRQIL